MTMHLRISKRYDTEPRSMADSFGGPHLQESKLDGLNLNIHKLAENLYRQNS